MKNIITILLLILSYSFTLDAQWSQSGPAEVSIMSLEISQNGTLYAGTKDNRSNNGFGIYKSTDGGESWNAINTGLPLYQSTHGVVRSIACKNDTVFIYHGLNNTDTPKLYRSVNAGGNWSVVTTPMDLGTIVVTQNTLLIGNGSAVYRSTNGGTSWTLSKATTKYYSLFKSGDKLFLTGDSLFVSTNEGASWEFKTKYNAVFSPKLWGNGTTLYGAYVTGTDRLSYSTNDGATWIPINSASSYYPATMFFAGAKAFLVHEKSSLIHEIYSTTDNGTTWETIENISQFTEPFVNSHLVSDGNMYIGFGALGILSSTDNGVTWRIKHKGLPARIIVNKMINHGNEIYAAVNKFAFFKSTDNGLTWNQYAKGIPDNTNFSSLAISGDTIFASTSNGKGFFQSTNNGLSWTKIGSNSISTDDLFFWNGKLFHGGSNGVEYSTNRGATWTAMQNGLAVPARGMRLLHNRLFYYTQSWGLWMWADTSTKWIQVGKDTLGASSSINNVVSLNGKLYASTGLNTAAGAVYYSEDNGITWNRTLSYPYNYADVLARGAVYIAAVGNSLVAAVGGQFKTTALFASSNGGNSWTDITGDLPQTSGALKIKDMYQLGSELVIPLASFSGLGYSLYRRELAVLSTPKNEQVIPSEFKLFQNYPNPFNPLTTIRFELPVSGLALLKVYDILGREVAILLNEQLKAGYHVVKFNASTLSSGVYFYTLRAGDFVASRKLLLIK